ncbi:MAG TPA: Asp-tRNA(Asn)/Glu-tRNA(Gln) amidotransferase subunit GatA [Verrucomicrobiae bacterium]|nr:Asp-tRNA(Asn)/Glu-tRNA(Gln) amidotransferase subunit GatA [Verrucomicrobiae bacterium]
MELHELTVREASEKLASKEISATELTKALLKRTKELEPKVHAFLAVTEERALNDAKVADEAFTAGGSGLPLTGIPFAAKDNILIEGIQATAASKILVNYKAPYSATSMKRLMVQNPVLIGKTNLDEFAMGSSTENSAFGPSRNPHDLERVPGGSSGGSAAAVAAGDVLFAFGTDTGGSVRQPASFCGVVGFKPTYGRISRYGLIALGSSLDQLGIFAKTVEDVAVIATAVSGADENDTTSLPKPVPDYASLLKEDLKGMKIGIPKEYFIDGTDKEVEASVKSAIKKMEELGATVEEMSLPHASYSLAAYYIIMPVEVSANLSRYDGIRYGLSVTGKNLEEVYFNSRSQGFGPEAKRRIMIGTHASSAGYADAYYKKAKLAQKLIKEDFVKAFSKFDLLITPTAPTPAFKVGEKSNDPLSMYLADIFTVALNIAGVPGISVPCGVSSNGLPIGVQLIAPHFKEENLFIGGHALQKSLNLKLKPNI